MNCVVCEGELKFVSSVICKACLEKIASFDGSEYAPFGRRTKSYAVVNLILAIRSQAILDDELKEFEEFWIVGEPWKTLWELMKRAQEEYRTQLNELGMEGKVYEVSS